MNVLVTGGAGYIGSHAVKMLKEQNFQVAIVDNLSTGHESLIDSSVPFYEGSILNKAFLHRVFDTFKPDAVLHFAAFSLVGDSVKHPLVYYKNNVEGSRTLLEVMQHHSVEAFILSSTAAVYGEVTSMPINEDSLPNPTNPYGATKKTIEDMLQAQSVANEAFNYVALRYFNVAGASLDASLGELHNPETHLIPNIIKSAFNASQPLKVFGTDYDTEDGSAVRDYIHVEDLVDAHIKALKYLMEFKESNIFNLGSQRGYSVLEIIKTSEAVLGVDIPYVESERRPGDPAKLIASHEKANRMLNWEPKHTLKTMIETAYEFYKGRGLL